jgi:hypothetical protein
MGRSYRLPPSTVMTPAALLVALYPADLSWVAACLVVGLAGLSLMGVEFLRRPDRRKWSTAVLLAGLAYAVANAGVFLSTLSVDPFAIFDPNYLSFIAGIVPALVIGTLLVVASRRGEPGWRAPLGFGIWVGAVAFGHLWMIAAASASV